MEGVLLATRLVVKRERPLNRMVLQGWLVRPAHRFSRPASTAVNNPLKLRTQADRPRPPADNLAIVKWKLPQRVRGADPR
jgi:hypothetical protein